MVKSIGPIIRSPPRAASQAPAAAIRASSASLSCSTSMKPNIPQAFRWNSLKAWSIWALMRPTTSPSRRARNSSASPCLKKAFRRLLRKALRSRRSGGTHCSALACSRNGSSMNSRSSRRERTGCTSRDTAAPYMPTAIDLFEKARKHERLEQLQAAREHDLLPYFRVLEGPAGPEVEMEGRRRIMLGSNNYLGLTGDHRVKEAARDALERFGTGLTGSRFLNGTLSLHLELERELADWMGTDDALVFTTGYLANTGTLGTLLGPEDTVICDTGDHASILDAVSMSRARIRPFRHNRLDKLEPMLSRAESDGGGVLVVVDGVFSMEGDLAPVPDIVALCREHGARLMVDEAHGVGVLGARGAGACEAMDAEDDVDLRMGTFSKSLASCGGFIAGPAD